MIALSWILGEGLRNRYLKESAVMAVCISRSNTANVYFKYSVVLL